MSQTIITTDQAPAAIGPYSQAILAGGFLFTAGQIPLDPKTGQMVEGDIKQQTRRVFENLKAVLMKAGSDFRHVVKATVYLTTMEDFSGLNEVYTEYLGETKPARSTVAAAQLPKGAKVEIDLIVKM